MFPTWRRCKAYLVIVVLAVVTKAAWVWVMREDGREIVRGASKQELLARRRYLIERLYGGEVGPSEMPGNLPAQFQGEWALVTYSMTAAALTNLGFMFPETRDESVIVIEALLDRAVTPEFRAFDTELWGEDAIASLNNENGHIGYLGHLNWMLSAYRAIGGRESKYDGLFTALTEALVAKLRAHPGLCFETYPDERYVPDNVVALASIANYSRSHSGAHRDLLDDWGRTVRRKAVDPKTGLLSFHLSSSCDGDGVTRGSGAGWNSYYLPFIDPELASEQFVRLKRVLLQRRLVTGIREYPRDVMGFGDVDSGPVILGFSASGTGFAIGGAAHHDDLELMTELLLTAEIVGSSIE